ncbi:uncharacterized protein LOC108053571 [Drosophila rhopaloa]|uniref:Uncharacterized protein n=2 Tax=Drosophila rhopaloa TaxID=1041015 RepID=A0ABM5J4D5_DRORH|nr:uncharacterized protein LOC108053571 [Drosophila rhopaloa]
MRMREATKNGGDEVKPGDGQNQNCVCILGYGVEFTNFKCESVDKDFCEIDKCFLKSVNRTYKYSSLKIKLLRIPVTKVKINFALYKRFNGYKPFLYNITLDACKFLENRNSNPGASYFFDIWEDISNMNHSCPYNHDIEIEKMSTEHLNHHITNILPFPNGRYMFEIHWKAYDIKRAVTQLYLSFT